MYAISSDTHQLQLMKLHHFITRKIAIARDGEVKQRQHFYHHGDTICHPKSGYVTTKPHGTSTCRRNNYAIFSDGAIFTFPTGAVSQPR